MRAALGGRQLLHRRVHTLVHQASLVERAVRLGHVSLLGRSLGPLELLLGYLIEPIQQSFLAKCLNLGTLKLNLVVNQITFSIHHIVLVQIFILLVTTLLLKLILDDHSIICLSRLTVESVDRSKFLGISLSPILE